MQILPLGEISGGETSPYSALSAFGIDPMFLSIAAIPDLEGDTAGLGEAGALLLARARASATIDYEAVRALKREALRRAFATFREREIEKDTDRAKELAAFRAAHRDWLDDYALFRALKDDHGGTAWWDWEEPLQRREPAALAEASERLEDSVLAHAYTQWLAHTQWAEARAKVKAAEVEIMGDLPFMVGRDSSDVWAHQDEFRNDCSVGVPPDPFSDEGQEWGLPPYHWDRMRENGYAWLKRRASYTASLFDRFRIDHLVGFYRTYMRPVAKLRDEKGRLAKGFFDPSEEPAQLAHGERVIGAMLEGAHRAGAQLVAEDLGVIPDFVRRSLAKLGVPGYKVLIWEKDDNVFRDPAKFPEVSLACFGTHDTDPVAVWWEGLSDGERAAVVKLPLLAPQAKALGPRFTPAVHSALVAQICASGASSCSSCCKTCSGRATASTRRGRRARATGPTACPRRWRTWPAIPPSPPRPRWSATTSSRAAASDAERRRRRGPLPAIAGRAAMLYGGAMSSHPTSFQGSVTDAIRKAIEEKIEGAIVEVTGGGGHFEIVATSSVFEGKGTLERQRLIYSAITHLMAGDLAPVHAVDRITTKTP